MGILAASVQTGAGMSLAEAPCSGIDCVVRELPACWGDIETSIGTGALSGEENMQLTTGRVMCMKNGTVEVNVYYGDEGLGDSGTYHLVGSQMEFSVYEAGAEGWGSFFSQPKVTCELALTPTKQLEMKSCSDGSKHELYDLQKN